MHNVYSFSKSYDFQKEIEKKTDKFISLLTVCGEDESICRAEETEAGDIIAFRSEGYSEEEYKAIRAQAAEWRLRCQIIDFWSIECFSGESEKEAFFEIEDDIILVENGRFFGVVSYNSKYSEKGHLVYAKANENTDCPVRFCHLIEATTNNIYDYTGREYRYFIEKKRAEKSRRRVAFKKITGGKKDG